MLSHLPALPSLPKRRSPSPELNSCATALSLVAKQMISTTTTPSMRRGGTTHSQVFPHDYTREKKKVLPRRLPLPLFPLPCVCADSLFSFEDATHSLQSFAPPLSSSFPSSCAPLVHHGIVPIMPPKRACRDASLPPPPPSNGALKAKSTSLSHLVSSPLRPGARKGSVWDDVFGDTQKDGRAGRVQGHRQA